MYLYLSIYLSIYLSLSISPVGVRRPGPAAPALGDLGAGAHVARGAQRRGLPRHP